MIQLWLRKNLFRSASDSVVTLVVGAIVGWAAFRFFRFVLITGRWDIARENLSLYMTGSWPTETLNRLALTLVLMALLGGITAGYAARLAQDDPSSPEPTHGKARVIEIFSRVWALALVTLLLLSLTKTIGPWLLVAAMIGAIVLGQLIGLRIPTSIKTPVVVALLMFFLALIWFLNTTENWDSWGGMLLNVFLAAISIVLCFPIGVLMALGRRSEYPIIRWICTAYIEVFRGLPLIALLLMANVALGFFIPAGMSPGKVVRSLVILTLFTSAYVAEIIRGGLQSVPKGQIEAGKANGLSPIPIMTKIVLPQAIRNVIPALVGQFISLFKDTTLVGAAMGVLELLKAAEASTAQELFRGKGLIPEALVFVLMLFWVGSYTMSQASSRLETRLGVGQR